MTEENPYKKLPASQMPKSQSRTSMLSASLASGDGQNSHNSSLHMTVENGESDLTLQVPLLNGGNEVPEAHVLGSWRENFGDAGPVFGSSYRRALIGTPRVPLESLDLDDGVSSPAHSRIHASEHASPSPHRMSAEFAHSVDGNSTARLSRTYSPRVWNRVVGFDASGYSVPSLEATPQSPTMQDEPVVQDKGVVHAVLMGIVNAMVGIPTLISFSAIVFQAPAYRPYLSRMAQLCFLSGAVHQAIFAVGSSLKFAVGQPQDVGLIFLSAMASSILAICREASQGVEVALGSTMLCMCISTSLVGVLVIMVGRFKLARLVQYVPLPVVGGYLGYVGYFCLAAGVGLGCNLHIDTFVSWRSLAAVDPLIKLIPTMLVAIMLLLTMKLARNPLALPLVLLAIPLVFLLVLFVLGISLETAQDNGWMLKPQDEGLTWFWEVYELLDWKSLNWSAILLQWPKLIALFFVVAFGSSLDVAAIQADMPDPIDFNRELVTVGTSNLLCGFTGAGYTGSYIFSQTIFSMRAGVGTRLHGIVIALAELLLFVLPFNVVQYMPNFFFGSLLVLFGIEIMQDWMIRSYEKVPLTEFVLLWLSFLAIMGYGLEVGIGIGIILCALYFAYEYAQVTVTAFTVVPSWSGAVRPYEERALLERFSEEKLVAVSLAGYIFFGSAVRMSDQLVELVRPLLDSKSSKKLDHITRRASRSEKMDAAMQTAPFFLMLDFRRVHGMDATAAQTFGTTARTLERMGVELLLTHFSNPKTKYLLEAHGVVAVGVDEDAVGWKAFASIDDGMKYCEDRFLDVARRYGLVSSEEVAGLPDILRRHMQDQPVTLMQNPDYDKLAASIGKYGTTRPVAVNEVLFDFGMDPDVFYIVESGEIDVLVKPLSSGMGGKIPEKMLPELGFSGMAVGAGGLVGITDFIVARPRCFRGVCKKPGTRVMAISRESMSAMAAEVPQILNVLQVILLRDACLNELHAYENLLRSGL